MTQEQFQHEAARLRPKMLGLARRYVGEEDAEDLVQDALLRLWQLSDSTEPPLDRLMSVIVRHKGIDAMRRKASKPRIVPTDTGDTPGVDSSIERMMDIVATLPPMQQTVLQMRHIEQMGMEDIASMMNTTEEAVRKALSRARLRVREIYIQRYAEHP